MAKDRWPELCRLVEQDDDLPVRDNVGAWTENKLCFWNRYVDITTRAMVGHPKWPEGLVYVDLFGGPGVCVLSGSRRRIPGSPLIAAHSPKPFQKILFTISHFHFPVASFKSQVSSFFLLLLLATCVLQLTSCILQLISPFYPLPLTSTVVPIR